MSYAFASADAEPEIKQNIYHGDEIVGHLVTHQKNNLHARHHACIRLDEAFKPFGLGIAQGFGDTPDEAIRNAFISARQEQQNYLLALASREQQLLGEPSNAAASEPLRA